MNFRFCFEKRLIDCQHMSYKITSLAQTKVQCWVQQTGSSECLGVSLVPDLVTARYNGQEMQ